MSYKEKRTLVSIITGMLILGFYCIFAFGKYQSSGIAPDDMKFWATTILTFIAIGIAASIVIQIIFHILMSVSIAIREKVQNGICDDKEMEKTINAEMVTDEMDKLIELKSLRVGFVIAGIGFVAAMLSLFLNYSFTVMINILFISFSGGSLLEGFAQLYFYRKGL